MTNPYYTRAFNSLAGSLARARQMINEFQLIQSGFDAVDEKVSIQLGDLAGALDYSASTAYVKGDYVRYLGAVYRARQATAGNLPTDNTYWQRVDIGAKDLTFIAGGVGLTLRASALIFRVDSAGSNSPSSITLTAFLHPALAGPASFSVISGSATLTGTGNARTLSYAGMVSDTVTIRASVVDGLDTYTDEVTLYKVRDDAPVATAAQFDNSTKPASTAFVKNSGLQINNIRTLTGATTLSSSDLGGEIVCNGSTYTVTLPATTGLGLGAYGQMLLFSNVATGDTTVAGNGADVITCGINSSHSFVVKSGDRALLVLSSAGFWILVGGEASLKYSGSFGASIAPNGYQMLPTGYMRQWGTLTLVTSGVSVSTSFPVAFPNACRGVVLTPLSVVTAPSYLTAPPSVTGFTAAQGFNGATSYSYEAWGY